MKAWELSDPLDLTRVQRSVDKNPGDWMAWWLLATTLRRLGTDEDRASSAEKKAAELTAGNPAIGPRPVPKR